jgi:galactokinase
MSDVFAHAQSLRDVEADWLPALEPEMDPVLFRRLRHVVRENERVDACVAALSRTTGPDLEAVGDILNAGHASLRDDYEVSIVELDVLCEEANRVDGVYGSRMTGAGFGGSALHLVRSDAGVGASEEIGARFRARFGRTPTMLIVKASDGATVESPSRS